MQALLHFPIPPPERPGELACRLSPHAIKNFWYPGICHNTSSVFSLTSSSEISTGLGYSFPGSYSVGGGGQYSNTLYTPYIHLYTSYIQPYTPNIQGHIHLMCTHVHLYTPYIHLCTSSIQPYTPYIHPYTPYIHPYSRNRSSFIFFFLNAVTDKLLITTRCVMVGCRWIHPTPFLINRYQVNFVKGVILWQLNQIIALR